MLEDMVTKFIFKEGDSIYLMYRTWGIKQKRKAIIREIKNDKLKIDVVDFNDHLIKTDWIDVTQILEITYEKSH